MLYSFYNFIDSRPRLTLTGLLVLVLLVRLIVAGVIFYPEKEHRALNTDQWGGIAKNIIDGYGYVGGQGHVKPEDAKPNSERGPIPVFFLAALFYLFGYKLWVVMIANWLCDVGTAYLIYRIAREVFPNHLYVAYISILLWALYVPEITITNRTYSEPLFTLLVAGHIWTVIKLRQNMSWPMGILSGILLGLSALSRGIMLLFLPVVWVLLLSAKGLNRQMIDIKWLKKLIPICLLISVTFGVMLIPWLIGNYLVFNALSPAGTLASYGLLRNTIYFNTGKYNAVAPARGNLAAMVEKELQARGETLRGKTVAEVDQIYWQLAFERIKAHPEKYLISLGFHFTRLWFNIGFGAKPSTASYMVMLANGILLVLLFCAFIWFRGPWVHISIPIVGLIIYNVSVWIPFGCQVRYIFPVIPYVILFASFALIELFKPLGKKYFVIQN